MARVTLPEGTSPSAHIENVDFAGKTGSAQVVSNAARRVLKGAEYNDNGWFVGFTPRRNPDVVVCVLFQGGEHGKLAARLAAQVIKAYVDKQRRHEIEIRKAEADGGPIPNIATIQDKYSPPKQATPKVAAVTKSDIATNRSNEIDFSGVWHDDSADEHQLKGGKFRVHVSPTPAQPAKAAPGMQ
jgi:penicillin-binding protein 2